MVGLLGDMLEGSWNENLKDQACGYKLASKVNVYIKAVSAIAEFKKVYVNKCDYTIVSNSSSLLQQSCFIADTKQTI